MRVDFEYAGLRLMYDQNPPSIPTLALVWLIGAWTGSKVIIDWHNLGYTILALRLGERHLLVRVAQL
jgi:beta-1,4-mannosyltransferase